MSADYDSIASRTGIKETCADMDRGTVVSSLFGSVSKKKREIETKTLCKTLRDRQKFSKSLKGKLNWPCEEKTGSAKIIRSRGRRGESNIAKREIQILLFMRSIWSLNPNDYSCNRRTDGLIRLKEIKSACMENWQ